MLSLLSVLPFSNYDPLTDTDTVTESTCCSSSGLLLQPDPKDGEGKMRSIVFKSQDYCRVELKDFDFDVKFSVVSATVYFTGANFKGIEKGFITSNSLRPVRSLMDRCQPGSIVIFDDVKVKGPGDEIRPIDGVTYKLY